MNAGARLIFNQRYHDHITPLLKQVKCIIYKTSSIMKSCLDVHAPNCLSLEIVGISNISGCSYFCSTISVAWRFRVLSQKQELGHSMWSLPVFGTACHTTSSLYSHQTPLSVRLILSSSTIVLKNS